MMKVLSSTYRLTALIMAFLLLFTSAGFAVDMHFCGGALKSVSFLGKAKTCQDVASEATPMKNCPHHQKMMAAKDSCKEDNNCCSSKTVHLQADQDQQIQTSDIVLSKQLKQFVIAYVKVFFTTDFAIEREAIAFALYKPPLISKNIPVLNQSFLL